MSAGVCRRLPGLLPPPGAGATVVVGSSGVASATWAVRRALGTMTANTATVVIIFFTQVPSTPSLVALPNISKRQRRLGQTRASAEEAPAGRCSSATPAGLAKGLTHRSGSLYHLARPRSALRSLVTRRIGRRTPGCGTRLRDGLYKLGDADQLFGFSCRESIGFVVPKCTQCSAGKS